MPRFLTIGYRRHWIVAIAVIVLTLVCLPAALRIRIDVSVDSLYPPGSEHSIQYQRARTQFGSDETLAIFASDPALFTAERLDTLQRLCDELQKLPLLERINSLFKTVDLRARGDTLDVSHSLRAVGHYPVAIDQARQEAVDNPLASGTLISRDGTALLILVHLDPRQLRAAGPETVSRRIEALIEPARGHFEHLFQIGGPAVDS